MLQIQDVILIGSLRLSNFKRLTLTLVKEALIEIGCVVTSLAVGRWLVGWSLVGWSLVVGCHARALWPNGAS